MRLIDANARRGCDGGPMAALRLLVELETGEHVAGWLGPERGSRERFDGLLELVAALDRLRGADAAREATAESGGPHAPDH